MEGGSGEEKKIPIFRDIRRYYCEHCGICRSKKSLIASHMLSRHKEELENGKSDGDSEGKAETNSNICEECGASFRKPAYLQQHMQSHSLERPFVCPIDDCHSSYRRKDHLTRHLLQHQGKLFDCPLESCKSRFAYRANMKRHIVEIHDESDSSEQHKKEYVCQEAGCGKVFRYASRLRKHEDSHVKLDSVEVICCEPGCMKSFSNEKCLREHIQSCHQHLTCEVCDTKQLKKNIKRHMRIHEAGVSSKKFKCNFEGCLHFFTNKSNLNQHVKAVHLDFRPFVCRFDGCGKKFSFKHVRDNHEISGSHLYVQGSFVESDAQFQSRPRGGRKRKYPTIDMLQRKRVVPPGQVDSIMGQGSDYLAWLLSSSDDNEDQQVRDHLYSSW